MKHRLIKAPGCLSISSLFAHAQNKFYNYSTSGQDYLEKKDWIRAIGEFKSAASLEFADTRR